MDNSIRQHINGLVLCLMLSQFSSAFASTAVQTHFDFYQMVCADSENLDSESTPLIEEEQDDEEPDCD